MGQNNFMKIFSILAFISFATVSCWATAESLHLLLSSWPVIFCWLVTIGFFVIASLGTKMIVDSFNQNIYMEKRGLHLLGGIIITIVFWLLCIMPTNTHTFFFRNVINDKVNSDIATTQNYLRQIMSDKLTEDDIKIKSTEIDKIIDSKLIDLKAELENSINKGNGKAVKKILMEISQILGIPEISQLSGTGNSIQERDQLYTDYRRKIYDQRDIYIDKLKNRMQRTDQKVMKDAEEKYKNLSLVSDYINGKHGKLDVNKVEDIQIICKKLNEGYSVIKDNQQMVSFNNNDKALYTAQNPVTKVKRLTSVFDVWEDFLKGEYAGHGFIFWILISVLVDISAFIFFDISFKRQN